MREVEYAQAGDGTHIAFRVLDAEPKGATHNDIVMTSGGVIPMELFEEDPGFVRLLDGLRSFGRVVLFDRRGIGLSDPIVDWERPVLDQWADDLAAVVQAAGVEGAVVFAWDGWGVATRFAAKHPDRLRLLVLHHPATLPDDAWDNWIAKQIAAVRENLDGAQTDFLEQIAPTQASDASFREWYARAGRVGASPATASRIWESVLTTRASEQRLEQVATTTLVLHRRNSTYFPPEAVRLVGSRIRDARVVELDGADHWPFVGDVDAVVAEVANFVVGERRLPPPQRILAAIMFTDLVASTERTAALGDARWKSVIGRHDAAVRAAVGGCGGTIVKSTGDGVLALLPSAGAAVRCAPRIRDALAADGLDVRIGIHVGDIDHRADDVSGLGVVVAARTMATARAGQIVVTASVPPSVLGQIATFESLGEHELRGVPGLWELYQLSELK